MPASICDPVSSALRLSLNTDESPTSSLLDSRLYSSAKNVLLSKIEFEDSGDYQNNVLDGLKSKCVVIRPKKTVHEIKLIKKDCINIHQSLDSKNYEDGLPKPKKILFPIEKVQQGWQCAWTAGGGMQNLGNTCYLNSTLQALFHVSTLANWLISDSDHSGTCNQQESCVICGMRATLIATQKSSGSPIKPWQIYSKLRLICRHLTPGRQEDAHEFLRYLVEAMEKCYLQRFLNADKFDQYTKETTPLNQILGGYLRSTVRCLACHHLSTTYQHFQDLLLDIRKPSTLDEALDSFFARERLEDLGYKCEACNKKVSAIKQFFVERAPTVLCIVLKRFSLAGGKQTKHVQFRKKINVNKYMYNKNIQQQLSYKLVSIVSHFGSSPNCGHYTAIGQGPKNNYYQYDDSSMKQIPLSAVLGTNAYIMLYEKEYVFTSEDANLSTATTSSAMYGPHIASNYNPDRNRSPPKLFYNKNDDKKQPIFNISTDTHKIDTKPLILNSTLSKSHELCSHSEPWTVKRNGEVEKVIQAPKLLNGSEKPLVKSDEDRKITFIIKRQATDENDESKLLKNDSEILRSNSKINEKTSSIIKVSKIQKSPLQKLEEQMHNSNSLNCVLKNGCTGSRLVPYDSESSNDSRAEKIEEEDGWLLKRNCKGGRPKSTHHVWTVSSENSAPLPSPSLNGVTNKLVKEKEESPLTSVSSMSPLSDRSEAKHEAVTAPVPAPAPPAPATALATAPAGPLAAARLLQTASHRGYGAPVATWSGTHSALSRQVFEERREERKRAFDASDEMDQGRNKKVKKFHHYNRFNNNRNGYNPFQEKQNRPHWNGNFKYHGERRPPHHFNKHHNKYKRFNNSRYNSGHHYSRHH